MTLYEFNILTLEEKQATVWDKGTFVPLYNFEKFYGPDFIVISLIFVNCEVHIFYQSVR